MKANKEVKDSSYWNAYDDALSEKANAEWEQQNEIEEKRELELALKATKSSSRLIDYSGDDSSLDSRFW